MRFDATEAALEGFRLARREPKAMLIWAVLLLAFSVISTLVMIGAFPGLLGRMETTSPGGDPQEAFALMGQMGQMYAIIGPLYLLFYAVLYCAAYRAVLRPEDKGFGFVKLGGDELRMLGLMLYQFVVWMGLCIGLSIVFVILAVVVALLLGGSIASMENGAAGMGAGIILAMVALYLVFFGAVIYLGVRLSLAAPKTFAEKKISLFSAWSLTKGNFWSLLGCYLLAAVIGIVVSLLGAVISMVGFVIVGEGSSLIQIFNPDLSTLQAYFTPGRAVALVINSLIASLTYAIFLAPPAAAYRDLTGGRPAE